MNYRHQYHAGNFADVLKHVLLLQLVRALQQKPKGWLYLDTHAGRGGYDLARAATGDSLARTPEWPDGIGRLWAAKDLPSPIRDYVDLVRQYDQRRGNLQSAIQFYPGSPWLVAALARPEDRLALFEMHPAEAAGLREEVDRWRLTGLFPRVTVHEEDGYNGVRSQLPPAERRGIVLIDPPYEAQNEFALVARALEEGMRRLAHGVFAVWYPLTQRARVQEFFTEVERLNPPPTLAVELEIAGEDSARKMRGCGLLVVNPPWQFDAAARGVGDYLASVLAQDRGGGSRTVWIVPER